MGKRTEWLHASPPQSHTSRVFSIVFFALPGSKSLCHFPYSTGLFAFSCSITHTWYAIAVREKVKECALHQEDRGGMAMLRLMLVTVVASYTMDDDLLSECQVGLGAGKAFPHENSCIRS